MPLDISGRYIWMLGDERVPYIYIEGEIRTELPIEAILAVLDSSLTRVSALLAEQTAYRIPDARFFDVVLLRSDKRCALIVTTLVNCSGSIPDRLEEMAEEVRRFDRMISKALSEHDGAAELRLGRLDCQIAVPLDMP